jgi:hypothetical protein
MRTAIILASCLALTSADACNTARDQQEKADRARADADRKIAEANAEAARKTNEAQAEADKKTADAQLAFSKLREDYRHDVNTKLAELDKKIADLDAKEKTLKATKRTELDAKLTDIHRSRDAFTNDFRSLESASAATWDDVKKRLDKSLSELETKVNRA